MSHETLVNAVLQIYSFPVRWDNQRDIPFISASRAKLLVVDWPKMMDFV